MSVMRIKDAQGNWQEVAALHGLPGTSVSITSISQNTEDDGYSVVTFSDGKTLRVKNGSKGSAGEGGGGASKYTQPDWGAENGVVILPEITVSGEDTLPIVQKFDLEIGQEYVVHWNGTEYATACSEVQGMAAIGNIGAVTGTGNTGEPFVILRVPDDQAADAGAYGAAVALDGSTSATLSITGDIMHQIPAEYVEEKRPPLIVTVTGTSSSGYSLEVDTDFETIEAAIDAGRAVHLSHDGKVYPASGKSGLYINFSGTPYAQNPSIGVYEFVLYTLDSNGILTRDALSVADNDMLGELRVFLKDDGTGNYTADYPSAMINSRHRNGAPVTCFLYGGTQQAPIKVWQLVSTGETDKAVFSRTYISDGSVVISTVTIDGVNATVEEQTIPSTAGGGGGASDGVYELIEKYTSEEEAAFVRTQEPDGTPYKFKALFVKFEVIGPVEAYRSVTMEAMSGGRRVGYFDQSIQGDPYKLRDYTAFEVTQDKGYWRSMFCTATALSEKYSNVGHGGSTYTLMYSTEQYPYITKFASINYYPLPAGVKMEIWGVRA